MTFVRVISDQATCVRKQAFCFSLRAKIRAQKGPAQFGISHNTRKKIQERPRTSTSSVTIHKSSTKDALYQWIIVLQTNEPFVTWKRQTNTLERTCSDCQPCGIVHGLDFCAWTTMGLLEDYRGTSIKQSIPWKPESKALKHPCRRPYSGNRNFW